MTAAPSSALISELDSTDGAEDGKCASRPLLGALPTNNSQYMDMNGSRNLMRMDFSMFMPQRDAENHDPCMRLPQPVLA